MQFLTGTHHPSWLFGTRRMEPHYADFAVFPSYSTLRNVKTLKPAWTDWALDSMGFPMLKMNGTWTITAEQYVDSLCRFHDEIGRMMWAAPQDWMCEPEVISGGHRGKEVFVGTHLSVSEHQRRTVENFLVLQELLDKAGRDLRVIPVVQGWEVHEYEDCVGLYATYGVDLTEFDLVGVGSVCRREDTPEAARIFTMLASMGIRGMHGFGVKTGGIKRILRALSEINRMDALVSTDSLAWSAQARNQKIRLPGCAHGKTGEGNCANCLLFATQWRNKLCADIARWERQFSREPLQLALGAMDVDEPAECAA